MERKLEREKMRDRALGGPAQEDLPTIPDHYDWVGEPIVYMNLGYQTRNEEVDSSSKNSDSYYTVQASGDLLGMESRISLAKSAYDSEHREVLTFYKRPDSPDESMAGGLKFMAAGDIYAVSDSLIFSGGDGLGIDLQFGEVSNNDSFGKRVIEGDGPPNWEVELYRNGTLLDFQTIGSDGRYRFIDVPVEYGDNIFDIRIFGPQGQSRNKRESINVGNEMQAKGKTAVRLSYTDLGESLIDDKPENIVADDGTIIELREPPGDKKAYLSVKHGVTDWLALGAAFATHDNVFGQGEDNQYTELIVMGAFPGISLGFNHVSQDDAGEAYQLSGQTRLGNTSLSFLHKDFDDFSSDRNPGANLDTESEIRITGTFNPLSAFYAGANPISYSLIYDDEQRVNGSQIETLENLLGFSLLGGRMTINTTHSEFSQSESRTLGRTSYTRVAGYNTSIRAEVNYRIDPDAEATSATANITWLPTPHIRTQLGLFKDLSDDSSDSVDFTASYLLDKVTLSASAFVVDGGDNALFLSAEFSLGADSGNSWSISGKPRSQNGRLRARVFLDNDRDGIFSDGDDPLSGASFIGRSEWKHRETDDYGIAYLDNLSVDAPQSFGLNESSLSDPYYKSTFAKSHIISHAGGVQKIDIAVISTVEAEGSLSISRKGKIAPLAGIPITVKNADGDIIASAITEFDGFYVISGLPPGNYLLSMDQQALQRFKLSAIEDIPFVANADDGVVYIDAIVLR
ncbi:MSCRAMM family protein [Oceanicoccus sagamiensis]|uniref:MSCRAMM family protein n=1 Tax=Oceanicoccus sagamiensis TaxID=716816 RepID=UPI0012F4E8DD|nr:carboxypeptidase-like regulatory domain-containing protein [Oceanicoccus sagamiensis]